RRFLDAFPRDRLIEYTDRRGMNYRAAVLDAEGALAEALLVAPPGHLPPRDWLVSLLGSRQPLAAEDRRAPPSGRSPVPVPSIGRVVCACFNVGVNQITAAVARGSNSIDRIGAELRAGTNCGSCRSEIRRIIDDGRLQAAE